MAESGDLAAQTIAGRPGFIAEQELAVLASQLAHEAPYRVWRVVDVAEEADFPLAALLSQGYGDRQLGGIKTDEDFAILLHGSSPVREARRWPIQRNPRSSRSVGEPPPHRQRTYGLPDVLDRVQLRGFGGQRHQGDVGGDHEPLGLVPPRLIEQH